MSTRGYWFLIVCRTLFARFNPFTLCYITHTFHMNYTWSVLFLEAKSMVANKQMRCLVACLFFFFFHLGRIWPLFFSYIIFSKVQICSQIKQSASTDPHIPSLVQQMHLSGDVDAHNKPQSCSKRVLCQQVSWGLNACPPNRFDHGWSFGGSLPICVVAVKWSKTNNMSPWINLPPW